MKYMLALGLGLLMPLKSNADWISFCTVRLENPGEQSEFLRFIERPEDSPRYLYAGSRKPEVSNCTSAEIPFPFAAIEWVAFANDPEGKRVKASASITLTGKIEDKKFLGSIDWPTPAPESSSFTQEWPVNLDIKDQVAIKPYGTEERAEIRKDRGTVSLTCRPGGKPAGFLIQLGKDQLPPLMNLSFALRYRSSEIWQMTRIDSLTTERDPVTIHQLEPASDWKDASLGADRLSRVPFNAIGLICPEEGGHMDIARLELQAPDFSPNAIRSTWIWESDTWKNPPADFWDRLKQLDIRRLYVAFVLESPGMKLANPSTVSHFISTAKNHGIEVWAVEGDPRAVLRGEQGKWIARAIAYQAYNEGVSFDEQIKGIQFDVEPYINEGYLLEPDVWKSNYLALLRRIRAAIELPMDVAVPFWWGKDSLNGKPLVPLIYENVDSVTVMDYQTNRDEIISLAMPFIQEGNASGKYVSIALETGDLGQETQWRFEKSTSGNLHPLILDRWTILLKTNTNVSQTGGLLFNLVSTRLSKLSTSTFHGQNQALEDIIPAVEKSLKAWCSFRGLALHEVLKNQQ